MQPPRLYAIIDADVLSAKDLKLRDYAESLRAAGVTLVQYRDKTGTPQHVLRSARVLSEVFVEPNAMLILNDRSDLAVLAAFHGVHVGQDDLSPEDARLVLGPGRIIGVSTHTAAQVIAANASAADYIAIGPVFSTGTKLDAAPVVGLQGVRRAHALTTRPLVAIGGITLANARSVIDAGADSLAVVSGLFVPGLNLQQVATQFLKLLQ